MISFIIHGNKIMKWCRPCVYVWKRKGVVLYIGSSKNGVSRVFNHKIIKLKPTDVIELYYTKWYKYLEIKMIQELQPKFNKDLYEGKPEKEIHSRFQGRLFKLV